MIKRLLIANRGEISLRIQKTCKRMSIETVAVYSDADKNARHVKNADKSISIGGAESKDSYLNIKSIIKAAIIAKADAVHPGYGFLSENADFAKEVLNKNLIFIGPNPSSIKAMALKSKAKTMMGESGVPIVPGFNIEKKNKAEILKNSEKIGFPIIIKASAGGGGRGMKIVRSEKDLFISIAAAKREAKSSFGNEKIIIEKYLENARHVEVQIIGDMEGNFAVLGDRDCSLQRRHQKVIEEAPAPNINEKLRKEMASQAINVAKKISYLGAGTIEFLVYRNNFYFIEMNTRLQVEHPVTELIFGVDLVEMQLRIANGEKIKINPLIKGHSIEARIYAENPELDFLPSPGKITNFSIPNSNNIRADLGYFEGDYVSSYYDSMLGKLIVHGKNREQAINLLSSALKATLIVGVDSNIDFLRRIIDHQSFKKLSLGTNFIENYWKDLFPSVEEKTLLLGISVCLFLIKRSGAKKYSSSPWEMMHSWRHCGASGEKFVIEERKVQYNVECFSFDRGNYSFRILKPNLTKLMNISIFNGDKERNYSIKYNKKTLKVTLVKKEDNCLYIIYDGYHLRLNVLERFSSNFKGELTSGSLEAPMPGKVAKVYVKNNQKVKKGTILAIIEAMKMEHSIIAPFDGIVKNIAVKEGEQIEEGHIVTELEKINEEV